MFGQKKLKFIKIKQHNLSYFNYKKATYVINIPH